MLFVYIAIYFRRMKYNKLIVTVYCLLETFLCRPIVTVGTWITRDMSVGDLSGCDGAQFADRHALSGLVCITIDASVGELSGCDVSFGELSG